MAPSMESALEAATDVIDMHNTKRLIPNWILKTCKGVAIIRLKEAGMAFSLGSGEGVVLKHNGDGTFGPPLCVSVSVNGIGAILGGAKKDILLYPMTNLGLKTLTAMPAKIGGEMGFAAGPVGREADVSGEVSPKGVDVTYYYALEKGALIDVGISFTTIKPEEGATGSFYNDSSVDPTDVVMKEGAVEIPEGKGGERVKELHEKLAAAHKP